jgi:hypothetical protein
MELPSGRGSLMGGVEDEVHAGPHEYPGTECGLTEYQSVA